MPLDAPVWPTPAGAGSTQLLQILSNSDWAYPRWRGEHRDAAHVMTSNPGLPPLARGAPRLGPALSSDAGPTPAGAGSTTQRNASCSISRAYPRWRGEHCTGGDGCSESFGLPPLARGAPPRASVRIVSGRPTPAGAGSTAISQPNARASGPTPAGAGSTCTRLSAQSRTRAYPRWRGEHPSAAVNRDQIRGLPPLARGAPRCASARDAPTGPTPAGAGSTRPPHRDRSHRTAYPRWRGEHCRGASGQP